MPDVRDVVVGAGRAGPIVRARPRARRHRRAEGSDVLKGVTC
jgi:hypothetical protein